MLISGLEKCSFSDYPGKLAAVAFVGGCNLNCSYCHNQSLLRETRELPEIGMRELLGFLESRKGFLDAVVVTGGEPSLYPDLPELLSEIRKLGFLIKLDTNGTIPEMIEKLIAGRLVDYMAMDVKTSLSGYPQICRAMVDTGAIVRSIHLLIDSPVEYEFRTTVYPGMTREDLIRVAELIAGSDKWVLQHYRAEGNDHLRTMPLITQQSDLLDLQELVSEFSAYTGNCSTRGKGGTPVPGSPSAGENSLPSETVTGLDAPTLLS